MVSLCEQCNHNDWRYFQDIIDAIKEAGTDRPGCIWCDATDRPEDLKFDHCQNFTAYPPEKTSGNVRNFPSETRKRKKPIHMKGHRKVQSRKDLA